MIEIPGEFPFPESAFQRQRSLLSAQVEAKRQPSGLTRRRLIVIAAAILVGGLLVAPALGIGGRVLELFRGSGPTLDADHLRTPLWSPDGRRITFTGGGYLWVMNADGSDLRKLMRSGFWAFAWSPDGRRIALVVPRLPRNGLYVVNNSLYVVKADGSGRRLLTRRAFDDLLPGRPTGERSPSRAFATATARSTS